VNLPQADFWPGTTSGLPVIRAQSQADKADYIPTGRLHITGSEHPNA
jgi:hypothetical protein